MADPKKKKNTITFGDDALTPSQMLRMIVHKTSRMNHKGEMRPMTAIFIWGAPGIGKTQLVDATAHIRGSRIVALHLPQFDPTDIKGIPVRMDDGSIRWMPTSYLPQQFQKFVDNHDPSEALDPIEVDWQYAVGVAAYIFDRDGNEIARKNDPVLPDSGTAKFKIEQDGTKWKVSVDNLPENAYRVVIEDKAIVFLDELSAADPSTQNAALQLALDRRVGEYDVPHSVPVIAAGNRESDGAFVQELSHPLANRFSHHTLKPNASDWIKWALEHRLPPEVIGFIKWDPDALFDYDPDTLTDGQYGYATPRSWAFLGHEFAPIEYWKELVRYDVEGDNLDAKIERAANKMRMDSFTGLIGKARSSEFVGYLQVMHDLPHPVDVMAGTADDIGDIERSKSFGLLYALVYSLENCFNEKYDRSLSPNAQSEEWTQPRDNIIQFITDNFDSEAASWAMAVLFQQTDISTPALRCDAFLTLSKKYVHVMERVMNTPRGK